MSHTPIELKGSSFTLSVAHLNHANPEVIQQALQAKIEQAPDFFRNAPIVLNIAALQQEVDWQAMQRAIANTGLRLVGISGCQDQELRKHLQNSGLAVLTEGKKASRQGGNPPETPPVESVVESKILPAEEIFCKTKVISTPVRSGQQIYARNADLIVTGSVSAGAELVADGNIHIYGTMRGRALAGASGDQNSQIFATHLAAELVSIAGEYWIMDQIPADFYLKAARLSLIDGIITIEAL